MTIPTIMPTSDPFWGVVATVGAIYLGCRGFIPKW